MKWKQFFKGRMQSLTTAISRFPLTVLFLLLAAIINTLNIQTENVEYVEWMLACFMGALAAAVAQVSYEHFFREKEKMRYVLFVPAILFALLYYFMIDIESDIFSLKVVVRTVALVFALLMAFIWIPSIKSRLSFSDSFTAGFKSLFTTIMFSIVLGAGVLSILSAVNVLLIDLDYRLFLHASNIVASLFAPILFLSYIPVYLPQSESSTEQINQSAEIDEAISVPKTLEVLLRYIVIPLTMVFTIILALYILMNIGRDFWINNLLEPMLVSYAIVVILVMLFIGRLDNKMVVYFRLIFPKILFLIVLLQTVASVIQISEKGLTIGRYYVILFGVFAIVSSIIFSIWPKQKNGLVAVVLIVFSLVSITPPVDAFTVSKNGQIAFLEATLRNNEMLKGNELQPRSDLPENEQRKIVETVNDLEQNGNIKEVSFLPDGYQTSTDFESAFGFDPYNDGTIIEEYSYYYFEWTEETMVNVSDYQQMIKVQFDTLNNSSNETVQTIEIEGNTYQLETQEAEDDLILVLKDQENGEIIQTNVTKALEEIEPSSDFNQADLTFEQSFIENENTTAIVDTLVMQLNDNNDQGYSGELFVFVSIK
ncbi:DUF4153 domain-containing protein [Desemzia incerta]|uniref:DUF4153 domain-containing protein n=1 Tax=Desemzia incerta TaxID=82801 RepID=UPI0024C29955|nr:DUF4153 domain-containing protein [Desemzia incerta]WHZ33055.1 DUF4153 domain-containing protein [Desemzia incerta]